jgi:hypothetical protein
MSAFACAELPKGKDMTVPAYGRIGLLASFSVVFVFAFAAGLSAQEPSTYTIAAAPGYGVEDCLAEGGECGRVVADAWCEAHGRGQALRFGRSEESSDPAAAQAYFITCSD